MPDFLIHTELILNRMIQRSVIDTIANIGIKTVDC